MAEFAKIIAEKDSRSGKNNHLEESNDRSYSPPIPQPRRDIKIENDPKTNDIQSNESKYTRSPESVKNSKREDTPDRKSDTRSVKSIDNRICRLDDVPLPEKDSDTSDKSDEEDDRMQHVASRKSRSSSRSSTER